MWSEILPEKRTPILRRCTNSLHNLSVFWNQEREADMKILTLQNHRRPSPLTLSFLEVLREPLALSPSQYEELERVVLRSGREILLLLDRLHELESRLERLREEYLDNMAEIKMARQAFKSVGAEYIYANSQAWWQFRALLSPAQKEALALYACAA